MGGGRQRRRGPRDLSPTVILDRRTLWTQNAVPGQAVYGESLRKFSGREHRRWDPTRSKLGAAMLVFVEITLTKTSVDIFAEFSAAVQDQEDIQECHLVSGDFDFLLKARVADMSSYRKLLGDTLLRLPGVSESRTYVVMEEVKSTTAVRINMK